MPVYDTPLHTNDRSLDRLLSAGLPVALLLYDGRQGLTPALADALAATANAEAGKLLVARLDTTDNPDALARYGWAGQPSLTLFRDGEPLEVGIYPVDVAGWRDWVAYLLGTGAKPSRAAQATRPANGQAPAASNGAAGAASGATARPDLTRPVAVTDATFQREVLESDVPVVVDFWAAWCGPCRMIGPALEKVAAEMGGRVKIAKVDVDANQYYAQHYGVQGIPTLLFVRGGQVVDRVVGAQPEQYLRQRVKVFATTQ